MVDNAVNPWDILHAGASDVGASWEFIGREHSD